VVKIDITEARGDLIFFLMFICHQPYSEIEKIPDDVTHLLQKTFERWIKTLFGNKGKDNIREIAAKFDTADLERLWLREAEINKSKSEAKPNESKSTTTTK